MSGKTVHVAAAVIRDCDGQVLIARRPDDKHQGGLWEFPGGKVETGESVVAALGRELQEELGIELTDARPLIRVPYQYPDKSVLLDVYEVSEFTGEAWGREGQPVKWVSRTDLERYAFPAANRPILNACLLPQQIAITPYELQPEQWLSYAEAAIDAGADGLMLRCEAVSSDRAELGLCLEQRWTELLNLCHARECMLILNSGLQQAKRLKAEAVHLSSGRLADLKARSEFSGRWLSASCHSPEEIAEAQSKAVEFISLSPVNHTSSHPDVKPLGWQCFFDWVAVCRLPVYALGGVRPGDLNDAHQAGAQGVAGISAWWEE